MTNVRALVIDGPKSAEVQHVDTPVPGRGQLVVDVHRVGICGTDIELFTAELAYFEQGKSRFPLVPGHEWCGVVSATGPDTDPAWLGQRVTGDTMLGCGRCERCTSGRHHVCEDRHEIGIMGWPGALAEKVLVPAWSVYRLPDTVDDRAGAMVEPGGNAWRAAAAAGAGPGKTVLVWGPGTIGLLTASFANPFTTFFQSTRWMTAPAAAEMVIGSMRRSYTLEFKANRAFLHFAQLWPFFRSQHF